MISYENGVLTIGFDRIDAEVLDKYPDAKVVAFPGTGTDHIDIDECERRGIRVVSLKWEREFLKTIPSVAELTIWFMLELLRHPHEGRIIGNQLYGKKVCLIGGKGRIATHVKERLQAFGTLVHLVDKDEHAYPGVYDIISLHVPLNEATKGMIDRKFFDLMRPGTLLINTSRPQIVNKDDLIIAIKERSIRYGTDFFDSDLNGLALMTDHIGGYTEEAVKATEEFIKNKVKEYIK